jgi:hypothetical protein
VLNARLLSDSSFWEQNLQDFLNHLGVLNARPLSDSSFWEQNLLNFLNHLGVLNATPLGAGFSESLGGVECEAFE